MLCQLLFAATMWLWTAGAQSVAVPFHVVVHPSNPAVTIKRAELSAIFIKRLRSWPDGTQIVPVDQSSRSHVRQRFSRSIHRKSVEFVTRYWQRLIFSGRDVPPQELASDGEVVAFVEANPGAIGYIASDAPPDSRVKIIEVVP